MRTLIAPPLLSLFVILFFGVGYVHSTDQTDGLSPDCQQLKRQMITLSASISNSSAGNQGLESLVVSGLIGTQVKKSNNRNSLNKRIDHLNKRYNQKCSKGN